MSPGRINALPLLLCIKALGSRFISGNAFWASLAQRIKEAYPGAQILVATHSVLSYNAIGIIAGTSHYTALPGIDGIIGQTWSNTVAVPVAYEGERPARPFESGYIGYASFAGTVSPDQKLYALADPYADYASASWDYYEDTYKKTVVAQLLQPDVHRFEETLWLDRSFNDKVPAHYRTLQLSVFNALKRLSGRESTLYGGTQGIGVAISDTLSWQWSDGIESANHTNHGFYGVTLPLVERGIPISLPCLDKLESADDLKGLRLLIVCYDVLKPLSEKVNVVLADWVRQGGVLLSIGGLDGTSAMTDSWWGKQGETPLGNLFRHLGIASRPQVIEPSGPIRLRCDKDGLAAAYDGASLSDCPLAKTLAFPQSKDAFLYTQQGQAVGIQAAVGQGVFLAAGMSSGYFSQPGGADRIRALVRYALALAKLDYLESPLLAIERGDIIAAQALEEPVALEGRYLDLFDPSLPVVDGCQLSPDQSALLLDFTSLLTPGLPRYVHGGGRLCSAITEEADRTVFFLAGPMGTATATRLLGNGRVPRSVCVDGRQYGAFTAYWDDSTASLLLTIQHSSTEAVKVEILWGD